MVDPTQQFEIQTLTPLSLFGVDAAFTNSALFQVIAVTLIIGFMWIALRGRYEVPGRLQAFAEVLYEFVEDMVKGSAGPEAMRFFPLVFSLFMYILVANLLGMLPGAFTFTSHIIITAALALFVFVLITIYGFVRNGLGFLRLFAPAGVPVFMMPMMIPLEIVSYLARPFSLSMRLAVNMTAGHMVLKIFAGFAVAMGIAGIMPFVLLVGIAALELLVSCLQAYVFAILVSVYLNDAIHPAH